MKLNILALIPLIAESSFKPCIDKEKGPVYFAGDDYYSKQMTHNRQENTEKTTGSKWKWKYNRWKEEKLITTLFPQVVTTISKSNSYLMGNDPLDMYMSMHSVRSISNNSNLNGSVQLLSRRPSLSRNSSFGNVCTLLSHHFWTRLMPVQRRLVHAWLLRCRIDHLYLLVWEEPTEGRTRVFLSAALNRAWLAFPWMYPSMVTNSIVGRIAVENERDSEWTC